MHEPPSHFSLMVHLLLSSQLPPLFVADTSQTPDPRGLHVFFVHGSPVGWQFSCLYSQLPVPGLQLPAVSHFPGVLHCLTCPTQVPATHVSPNVQRLPSLQEGPVNAFRTHWLVRVSQVNVLQGSLDEPHVPMFWHAPAPLQTGTTHPIARPQGAPTDSGSNSH